VVYHILLLVGILAALGSVYSFYLGVAFDRRVSASISKPRSGFTPRVALIMPCKGAEPGLEANIEAVLKQDYRNCLTIIVTDSTQDPAYTIAASVLARHSHVNAQIHTSQPSNLASGKVAALLTALSKTMGQVEVYAFVGSDALIPPNWLTEL
jgi:cellulose synthase/poly-beta-1,6-N-acetylglucosamine synthase-like glycosyltransferase